MFNIIEQQQKGNAILTNKKELGREADIIIKKLYINTVRIRTIFAAAANLVRVRTTFH